MDDLTPPRPEGATIGGRISVTMLCENDRNILLSPELNDVLDIPQDRSDHSMKKVLDIDHKEGGMCGIDHGLPLPIGVQCPQDVFEVSLHFFTPISQRTSSEG